MLCDWINSITVVHAVWSLLQMYHNCFHYLYKRFLILNSSTFHYHHCYMYLGYRMLLFKMTDEIPLYLCILGECNSACVSRFFLLTTIPFSSWKTYLQWKKMSLETYFNNYRDAIWALRLLKLHTTRLFVQRVVPANGIKHQISA